MIYVAKGVILVLNMRLYLIQLHSGGIHGRETPSDSL